MQKQDKNNKKQKQCFSILLLPARSSLVQVSPTLPNYQIWYQTSKKIHLDSVKLTVSKKRLFNELEVYQWRRNTEFPICKPIYVNVRDGVQLADGHVELVVYLQHCPHIFNSITRLSLPQSMFLLKECMLGFDILLKRFGPFRITKSMIAMNQKGNCRVWCGQQFANNNIMDSNSNQEHMVKNCVQFFLSKCLKSTLSKIFFSKIEALKTLLSVACEIDNMAANAKIPLPSKFVPQGQVESGQRKQEHSPMKNKGCRISIKKTLTQAKQSTSVEKSVPNLNFLHRVRSSRKMQMLDLKASDQETTCTRNTQEHESSSLFFRHQSVNPLKFKIDTKIQKLPIKRINPQSNFCPKKVQNRSFSLSSVNFLENTTNLHFKSSNHLLDQNNLNISLSQDYSLRLDVKQKRQFRRGRSGNENDVLIQKLRTSHTESVIKNNGWKGITGLMQQGKDLNQSFHEGTQENTYLKEFKLQKLDSLNRRRPAMSILPQQFEDQL